MCVCVCVCVCVYKKGDIILKPEMIYHYLVSISTFLFISILS